MAGGKDRLRQLLNPTIKGPMADALLEALAVGDDLNDFNISAVHDQLAISTANRRYLDKRTSDIGFVRPLNIGISDDAFRELAIITTAKKQVTSVMIDVLEVFYGVEATRATMISTEVGPYNLDDGDQLFIESEGRVSTVTFQSEEFTDISQATAREVAAAITRQLIDFRTAGSEVNTFALELFDSDTGSDAVELISGVKGTLSTLRVLGGAADNKLKFPTPLTSIEGLSQNIVGVVDVTTSGPRVITLGSTGIDPGTFVIIKDETGLAGTFNITVQPEAGTIDGLPSADIAIDWGVMRVYSDGINWFSW